MITSVPFVNSTLPAGATDQSSGWENFVEQAMMNHESSLIGYATSILNDPDLARDVVQDTFIKLCQQDRDKVEESLKSWLFIVCRNRAFDILRKEKRNQPLDDIEWQKVAGTELQPDQQADHQERVGQLHTYLERLSANQRDVIILKFQQGLSYQEIHCITGLTTSNVGFLIHSGLKRLREILPTDFQL